MRCFAQWRAGAGAGPLAPRPTPGAPSGTSGTSGTTGTSGTSGADPAAVPADGYAPADIASAYRLPTSGGAGQTVAVVAAYDNPDVEKDLAVYRRAWGLPACTTANGCFRKVNQRGASAPPAGDPGWGVEIALDTQAVSATCPRCRLLLVEADSPSFDDIGAAVDRAVALGATIVNNSYGADEFSGMRGVARDHYTHDGVAMVVSSGDYGLGPAQFPAVLRSSVSVGGTSLRPGATAGSWSQKVWGGAGSGCSAYVAKPGWQHDTHCPMRTSSDVSAVADPDTGLAVYDTYGLGAQAGWIVVGGTSLSAPLVAGMIGLAGNAAALDTAQRLYQRTADLTDVVGGSNGYCGGDYLCRGVPGYDGPSGNGTPRGVGAL